MTIRIGDTLCGPGESVYVALEIGGAVDSLETALALTRVAGTAGADAVKVQILDADRLVGDPITTVSYRREDGAIVTELMCALLRRRSLTRDEWHQVKAEADRWGLDFIATVDYDTSLALALDLGADAIKICSGDVNHLAWIHEVGKAGKPVLLDTGHATLGEIESAVDAALDGGAAGVCVHHCPSGYPSPLTSINLRIITTLRQMFGDDVVVGFSDHSPGHDMDVAAVALGACMVEKPLALSRIGPGAESVLSLVSNEAARFVQIMRDLDTALGSPRRHVTPTERQKKQGARRSAFLTRDLPAGAPVLDAIDWRRPGTGIEPHEVPYLVGRVAARDLPAGCQLGWGDLR